MKNIKVLTYRRVSTQKQVEEGEGLEIQLERIEDFCKRNGYAIAKHFADEGISGASESIDREGIMGLLKYCKSHSNIDYVIIDKVDRLSRDLYQQLFIEKELLVYNVKILYAAQETLNGDNMMIDAMRKMMGIFAEMERKMINQRLVDGMRKKAIKGDKPVGRQPFGYEWSYDRKSTVINEAEARIIRIIFDLRIKGLSLNQIAGYLNTVITEEQRKQFNKNNQNRKWVNQSIHGILTNDYYLGKITYNQTKIEGNHQAIIDTDTWIKANKKM